MLSNWPENERMTTFKKHLLRPLKLLHQRFRFETDPACLVQTLVNDDGCKDTILRPEEGTSRTKFNFLKLVNIVSIQFFFHATAPMKRADTTSSTTRNEKFKRTNRIRRVSQVVSAHLSSSLTIPEHETEHTTMTSLEMEHCKLTS